MTNKGDYTVSKNPIESLKQMATSSNEEVVVKEESYDVRFCKCGSIHFIDSDLVTSVVTVNKELILICGGCGNSIIIGATEEPNYYDSEVESTYSMYSNDFNHSFTTTLEEKYVVSDDGASHIFSANPVIRYSIGKRPIMMTGYKANYYGNGNFFDFDYVFPTEFSMKNYTMEELRIHKKEWEEKNRVVNMKLLLRDFTDSELTHLSHYSFDCMSWIGTKYEKSYHSK